MIIANDKPIRIIGYTESSTTDEFVNEISKTHPVEVISTKSFIACDNKKDYQYIVSVIFDWKERLDIIDLVDKLDLDLITVIHDTVVLGINPKPLIGSGTFIFPFCNISLASTMGRHCIIGSYTLIGHYTTLGNNCCLSPGVSITGKSTLGNNCIIRTKSTVTNRLTVTDNVEIMAFSNVIKDITEPGRYIGSRAKRHVGP